VFLRGSLAQALTHVLMLLYCLALTLGLTLTLGLLFLRGLRLRIALTFALFVPTVVARPGSRFLRGFDRAVKRSSGQAVATEWAQKRVCRAFRQRGVIPLHARTPRRVVRRSRSHSVRFCRRGSAPIWRHRVLAPAPDFSATAVRARQTDSRQAVAHCVRKPVTRSLRAMVAPLRPYPTRSRGAQSASTRLGNHTLP
jgi:hypothetical protein